MLMEDSGDACSAILAKAMSVEWLVANLGALFAVGARASLD